MRVAEAIGLAIMMAAVTIMVTPAFGGTPLLSISADVRASVSGGWLDLGSIATIDGTDKGLIDKVSRLRLGRSPSPGKSLYLGREDLLARLRSEGVDISRVEVSLPDEIEVTRRYKEVSADEVRRFFADFVAGRVEDAGYQAKVEDVDAGKGMLVPDGAVTLAVPPGERLNLMGRVVIPIVVKVDGRDYARIRASGYVRIMAEALVANRRLDRSHTIREEDFRQEVVDLTALRYTVITDPSAVIGMRVRRAIEADEPIVEEAIEVAPLVKRGDMVTILAQGRYLLITTPGRAVEDGYRGKLVKVINLTSKKQIYGKVVDSNTVRVEY